MGESPFARETEAILRSLANRARSTIGKCGSAGIRLVREGEKAGSGFTDQVAEQLQLVQDEAGDGPCLDAARYLQIFNVPCIADVDSWGAFRQAAARNGVRSSMSVPLADGEHVLGTLSLYSPALHGFEECEPLAMLFATRASDVLRSDEAERAP